MSIITVVAAILSLSGQQTPQAPQAEAATSLPPVAVNSTAAKPEEARVCHYEQSVGSNRRQRVCVSVAERDQQRAEARTLRDRVGNDINSRSTSGFGGDSVTPQ